MDSLTRTLASLTGQGWQIRQHGYGQVVLSKPCEDKRAVRSWDIGVIVASLILLCTGTKVPPVGAMVLGVVSIAGIAWAAISMILWRDPILVLTLTRTRDGEWQERGPKLERG